MKHGAGRRLLFLAASLFLLASCRPPGRVPETVKIGLSAPFEGLYRDLGYEALYAVRLAVRQVNEAGGVGGRYGVELVALNDLNDPPEAVRQAREMAVDPGILGVVGGLSPRTAYAAAPEYERLGLPFVAPFAGPEVLGRAAGRLAAGRLGARSAVVLHGGDAADRCQADGFGTAFSEAGGSLLARQRAGSGAEAAGLLAGLGSIPDVVFLAAEPPQAAEWIASLRGAEYGGALLGAPEVGSPLTAAIAGAGGEGVYFVSPFAPPADDEGSAAYQALSGGVPPGGVAAWCYAAARDLLAAMDAALRSPTGAGRSGTGAALARGHAGPPPPGLFVWHDGQIRAADE